MARAVAFLCWWSVGLGIASMLACASEKADAAIDGGGGAAPDAGHDALGGSAGGGGSDAAADAPSCPAKAASCPAGCEVIQGDRADAVAKCWLAAAPIACWPGAEQIEGLIGCVKDTADGGVYQLASTTFQAYLLSTGAWVPCTSADWADIHVNCP